MTDEGAEAAQDGDEDEDMMEEVATSQARPVERTIHDDYDDA